MPRSHHDAGPRTRPDRCPGVVRPWPAEDGDLVRVRVPGGQVAATTLAGLAGVAAEHGDGDVHVTARANLQLRGVRHGDDFVAAIEALGLLPSRAHDQARNVMVSPLTGRVGGRLDLRPLAQALDAAVLADDRTAALSGRFLVVLDDGRGDLVGRSSDLALMALDADLVQLRVGDDWGPVVRAADAAEVLLGLVHAFLDARGDGPDAPWHVTELASSLVTVRPPDPRTAPRSGRPDGLGSALLDLPDGVLTPDLLALVTASGAPVVLTPWDAVVRTELLP